MLIKDRDKALVAKLKNKYKDEKVFVVPGNIDIEDKFKPCNKNINAYDYIGKYIYRYDAEYNNSFIQIIPYILISNKDKSRYYISKRIKGDARLVNSYSLGFGGHINECDGFTDVIEQCLVRELNEELNLETSYSKKFIGTVRDMKSETSEHAGYVFLLKFDDEDSVSVKEVENLEGSWVDKQFLFDNFNKFESWSRLIIDHIYEN